MKSLVHILGLLLISVAGAQPIPADIPVPSGLRLSWNLSSSSNIVSQRVYTVTMRSTTFLTLPATNRSINLPEPEPYTDTTYTITAINSLGIESLRSNPFLASALLSNLTVTVSCAGIGDVYACDRASGPWVRVKTNFTGTVGSWTNPPKMQFWKGPGLTMAWHRYN